MTTTDAFLEGYNTALAAGGLPPTRFVGEDGDDWDFCLVEHEECAIMLRKAEIPAYALSEPWQEHIEKGSRILLVDKCMRIAGDLRERYSVGELQMTRTPIPYKFPSEFLQAHMEVSGLTMADKPEVRELWRICTHAHRTWIVDQMEATKHPGVLPPPKTPKTSSWDEVANAPSPEWVIDSLIAKDSIVMLASAPTSGKSLLVLDWCLRMIHGMSWFGRRVRAGSVLYLCGEGAAGIGGRIRGWLAANPSEKPQRDHYLVFSHGIPTLSTPAGCVELGVMLENLAKRFGHPPALVVVDTLSQAFGEGDENDSSTVAPALKALADLRARFHFAILVLHHTKKEQAVLSLNSVRGSGAFTANVDIVLGVEVQDTVRTLRTLKLKDGEIAPPISFEIRGQETGRVSPEGDPERAPIIIPASPEAGQSQAGMLDQLICNKLSGGGTSGLSMSQLTSYTGIEEKFIFEALVRMEKERTVVKVDGRSPRFYLPAYMPEEKQ